MDQTVESYRDPIAWQKGVDLVCAVHEQTKLLPADERFGLIAQMRRAAASVPFNIAEGWGRHQGLEYIHFLHFSRGSRYELSTQADVCVRLGYEGDWTWIIAACNETRRILNALISAIQRRMSSNA